MIIDFTVKNFRSFWTRNTISFGESDNRPGNFIALYGPNASGKSNLVKALRYATFAMTNIEAVSGSTIKNPILQSFLLNEIGKKKPSFFEFLIQDTKSETVYRYGFEVSRQKGIVSEWFLEKANRGERTTERILFSRELGKSIGFGNTVPKHIQSFKENVPSTILALPYLANNNYEAATLITKMMSDRVVILDNDNLDSIREVAYKHLQEKPGLLKRVMEVMKSFDTSIKSIEVERTNVTPDMFGAIQLPDALKELFMGGPDRTAVATNIKSWHDVFNNEGDAVDQIAFDLTDNESLGIQKLIPLVTMFLEAEESEFIIVIDEFGSSMHPFMTKALVELFNQHAKSSQLLVVTHETYLLAQDLKLKPSQLWIAEKNRSQKSTLSSLADYRPRTDARLDKQYLDGRFGAVPIIFKAPEE